MGGASEPGALGRSSFPSRQGGRMLRLRRGLVVPSFSGVEVDLTGHRGRLHGLVLCLLGPHQAHPVGSCSNLCAGATGFQVSPNLKAPRSPLGRRALQGMAQRDWHAP